MKANKSATVKRRRLKTGILIEENVEVVDVGEGDDKIDPDVAAVTERRKDV